MRRYEFRPEEVEDEIPEGTLKIVFVSDNGFSVQAVVEEHAWRKPAIQERYDRHAQHRLELS